MFITFRSIFFCGCCIATSAIGNPVELPSYCAFKDNPEFLSDFIYSIENSERCLDVQTDTACSTEQASRWNSDIIVNLFFSEKNEEKRSRAENVIDELATKLGKNNLPTIYHSSSEPGNLTIFHASPDVQELVVEHRLFRPVEDFQKLAENADFCLARSYIGKDDEIISARIFVPEEKAGRQLSLCILEEIFNALGVIGDPQTSASFWDKWPPNYNDNGTPVLSEIHVAMLTLLYNTRSVNVSKRSHLAAYMQQSCSID